MVRSKNARKYHFLFLIALLATAVGCGSTRPNLKNVYTSEFSAGTWQDLAEVSQLPRKPFKASDVQRCLNQLDLRLRKEPAHKTNYGDRLQATTDGRKLPAKPSIIVLHETVISADETIKLFQKNHPNDADQASYHKLIENNGTQTTLVEDSKRAYGAGMSHYGGYTLRSTKESPGSINNIALHVSLESPSKQLSDSWHEGYSTQQYKSLAATVLLWQMIYGIPMANVTTHYAVDRSHSRYDPRNFRWDLFDKYHSEYARRCAADELAFNSSGAK